MSILQQQQNRVLEAQQSQMKEFKKNLNTDISDDLVDYIKQDVAYNQAVKLSEKILRQTPEYIRQKEKRIKKIPYKKIATVTFSGFFIDFHGIQKIYLVYHVIDKPLSSYFSIKRITTTEEYHQAIDFIFEQLVNDNKLCLIKKGQQKKDLKNECTN